MSNTKFTPGPWNYRASGGEWKVLQSAKDSTYIAKVRIKTRSQEYDGVEISAPDYLKANAKLISAAPELLDCLLNYRDIMLKSSNPKELSDLMDSSGLDDKIIAAIKKATT